MYCTHDWSSLVFSREISEAFNVLGSDPDCRSIVLSGNGKMFCAGIDLGTLAEMGQVTSEDGDVARKAIQFYKIIRAFQNYFMDIERVSLGCIYLVLQHATGRWNNNNLFYTTCSSARSLWSLQFIALQSAEQPTWSHLLTSDTAQKMHGSR